MKTTVIFKHGTDEGGFYGAQVPEVLLIGPTLRRHRFAVHFAGDQPPAKIVGLILVSAILKARSLGNSHAFSIEVYACIYTYKTCLYL